MLFLVFIHKTIFFSLVLEAIWHYWKRKAKEYGAKSDDAPTTDSGNSCGHSCHPTNSQARTSWSPPSKKHKVSVITQMYVRVKGAASTVS